MWKLGRETVRLLVKDERGVNKIRLGRKKAHTIYSVPESVAEPVLGVCDAFRFQLLIKESLPRDEIDGFITPGACSTPCNYMKTKDRDWRREWDSNPR